MDTDSFRISMIVCSICHDNMHSFDRIHSTKCGHLFHSCCLRRWMKSSSTCPECRQRTTTDQNHRVFLNFNSQAAVEAKRNTKAVFKKIEELDSLVKRAQLRLAVCKNHKGHFPESMEWDLPKMAQDAVNETIFAYEDLIQFFESTLSSYQKKSAKKAKEIRSLNDLDYVEYVMETTPEIIDGIVENATDPDLLAYKVAVMRKSLLEAENDKAALENRLEACLRELLSIKNKLKVAQSVNEAEGASNNEPEKRNKRKQKVTKRRCKTGTFFVQFRKNYYPNIIKIFYIKRRL